MALEEKNPTRNRITTLIISVSGYYSGYSMKIFNSMAVPVLQGHFGLQQDEADRIEGNLNFLYCFAATAGVLSMSYFNDRLGRLKTTMGADVTIVVLNVLLLVDSIYAIEVHRLFSGFITGIYNAASGLILVEMMTKSNSVLGNLMICAFNGLAGLLSLSQQSIFSAETMQYHWRLFICWPTAISALRVLYLYTFLQSDTPIFVYQNYHDSQELKLKLQQSFAQIYKEDSLKQHVEIFITERRAMNESQDESSSWERYKQLFSQTYFKRTVGCLTLRFLESFTGYPVLVFISTSFFTRIGLDGKFISVVFGVFSVVGSLSGIYFVGKFKRVPTMLGGTLIQAGMFLVMWVAVLLGSQSLVIMGLAVYLLGYWGGIGGVAGLYIAGTVPAIGIGVCTGLSWFTWSFVAKWCVSFTKAVGETNTLFFFALVCAGIYLILRSALVDIESQPEHSKMVPLIELSHMKLAEHGSAKLTA